MSSTIIHEDENGDATVESMDAELALYPCSEEQKEEEADPQLGGMHTDESGRWCFPDHVKDDPDGEKRKACLTAFIAEATPEQQQEMRFQMADTEAVSKLDFDDDKAGEETPEEHLQRILNRTRQYAALIFMKMRHCALIQKELQETKDMLEAAQEQVVEEQRTVDKQAVIIADLEVAART
jgi:hypothetical protein